MFKCVDFSIFKRYNSFSETPPISQKPSQSTITPQQQQQQHQKSQQEIITQPMENQSAETLIPNNACFLFYRVYDRSSGNLRHRMLRRDLRIENIQRKLW